MASDENHRRGQDGCRQGLGIAQEGKKLDATVNHRRCCCGLVVMRAYHGELLRTIHINCESRWDGYQMQAAFMRVRSGRAMVAITVVACSRNFASRSLTRRRVRHRRRLGLSGRRRGGLGLGGWALRRSSDRWQVIPIFEFRYIFTFDFTFEIPDSDLTDSSVSPSSSSTSSSFRFLLAWAVVFFVPPTSLVSFLTPLAAVPPVGMLCAFMRRS